MARSNSRTRGAAARAVRASPSSWVVTAATFGNVGVDQVLGRPGGTDADDRRQRLVVDHDAVAASSAM